MSVKPKLLILVDGSSYLYRAFHALPALTNSKGYPTGAIYGLINMLKKLITDYQPELMAVIFDAKGKTFRDEIYPEYKATRQAMPNDLISQIEPIHQIINALGIPLIMIPGVEADDVIGTLSAQAMSAHQPVLISTGDKDLAQLVNEKVSLINTMNNVLLDIEGVKQKFGIPPERIVDYLSLVGDTSDNIPGVPKVGPKTAVKWLNEYGTLDEIVKQAEKISGKVGENLRATLKDFPLIKSLVTIKMDVELPIAHHHLKVKPVDNLALIELYKEMEFKNWLAELLKAPNEIGIENLTNLTNYKLITTEFDFLDLLKQMMAGEEFAINIETTSLDYMAAKLVGFAFALKSGVSAYIPLGHDYINVPRQLKKSWVIGQLKVLLENKAIKKIGQNIKYVIEVLAQEDIYLEGSFYDTMLESYILDSASHTHDINSLALKYLGVRIISLEEIAGKGAKQLAFNQLEIEKAGYYAAQHVEAMFKLHQSLWPRIAKESGLKRVFEEIEMPLLVVLARMERNGVLIDTNKLKDHGRAMQKRIDELEQEAYQLAGQRFNLNSPKQLQEILFQILKLPILQKTPTGQPSTADQVLQELAHEFAVPRIISEYRSLSKLISTYTNALVEQLNLVTGRIHTFYNQSATSTGRLSSSQPNLQNIPIRGEEGRRIRQAFIAPTGYKMISADYSQIELRIMAHISQDPNLLQAFKANLDIHTATAAEVWNVAIENVTAEMRRNAKAINFGLIYGMSAFGLTRQLGIDRKAAQEYIDLYFKRYPNVKAYMDSTRKQVKENGFVETLWGRRLYLPDINSSQIMRQKAAERAAINAPLQGSAADIIKLAMIQINEWLSFGNVDATMIMQVHDELVFEVAEKEVAEAIKVIRNSMIEVAQLSVPLAVSIGVGDNWDEASAHS